MAGKTGYLRTLEAMIAIAITLVFITIVFPRVQPAETRGENVKILSALARQEDFRNCVVRNNGSCVNSTIAAAMPGQFSYIFNLSSDPNVGIPALPARRVFADSVYIAGNYSNRTDTIVRLYYYARE